jgi:hypothetical protein
LDDDGEYTVPTAAAYQAIKDAESAIEQKGTKDKPSAHLPATDTSPAPSPSASTVTQSTTAVTPVLDKSLSEFNDPEVLTRYTAL